MAKEETSRLVAIVTAFDEELKRFDYLVAESERVNMTSEKALRRAAKAAAEAAECEARIAGLMRDFADALNEARQHNEETQQRLRAREAEVVKKDAIFKSYLQRFATLGEAAKEVSNALALAIQPAGNGDGNAEPKVNAEALLKVDDVIAQFLEEAKRLVDDARAAELQDFARDVETLRKQIQSARNKLGEYAEKVQH